MLPCRAARKKHRCESVETAMVKRRKLRARGVARQSAKLLPKRVMYGELAKWGKKTQRGVREKNWEH